MPRKRKVELKKVAAPETFVTLVAHFLDFLSVSIHTILYERSVYPREAFEPARRYNYPVRHCRVPEVNEWIREAIDAVEEELKQNKVERISLIITSVYDDPLERFVFDLDRFPVVTRRDWYVPFASTAPEEKKKLRNAGVNVVNMEQQFRAVITKLQFCSRDLDPLPNNVSWNISVEVKDEAAPPGPIDNKRSPWIPADPSLQHEPARGDLPAHVGEDVGGAKMTPIRNVEAGEMVFEIWAEETASKIDARDQEHFGHEYEQQDDEMLSPDDLPGFHMEPREEPRSPKGKGKEKDDGHADDFNDDDSDNFSQLSFELHE